MSPPMIPAKLVQKLVAGSYENLAVRLTSILSRSSKDFFGEDCRIRVIGTFKNKAVVVSNTGKFANIFYESASNGEIVVVGKELIEMPVLNTKSGMISFLEKEADHGVGFFMEGATSEMQSVVLDLMRTLKDSSADDELAHLHTEGILQDRPWRHFLANNIDSLGVATIDQHESKFISLTGKTLTETDQAAYRSLITKDLSELTSSFTELHTKIQGSVAELTKLIDTDPELLKNESIIGLKELSVDLMEHITETQHSITGSVGTIGSISALGELYDTCSLELTRRTTVGNYISQAITGLVSGTKI